MKGFDRIAIGNLINKRAPVSKLFGLRKTEVRKEINEGVLSLPEKMTEAQFVEIEAKRRTHTEIRDNDDYEKFRDEYDGFHPDAT